MAKQILKFKTIEFTNFRPFKNTILEFSQDSKKTVTVFQGRNSAGKTSIVHGIEWCLYGEEKIGDVTKGRPRCNVNALNALKVGDSVTTSVKITLADKSGPKYTVERTLTGKKNFDSKSKHHEPIAGGLVPDGMDFSLAQSFGEKMKDGNWDIVDDDNRFVARLSRIIPRGIFEFIVFDGERLDYFFKTDTASRENIKTGIEKVSGLPILEKAILHWEAVEKRFARYVAKNSGADAQQLQDSVERLESIVKKYNKEITLATKQRDELKGDLLQQQAKQDTVSLDALNALNTSLASEEVHKKEYQRIIEKCRSQRQIYLIDNFPLFVGRDLIKNAAAILQDSETKELTPPPVTDYFINRLVQDEKCMCGTDLSSNEHALKTLIALGQRVRTTQIAELASEGKILLNGMLNSKKPEEIKEELDAFTAEENHYEASLKEATQKVNGLMHKLEDVNESEIRRAIKSIRVLREQIEKIESEMRFKDAQQESKEFELKQTKEKLEKAEGESDANKQWRLKREFAIKTLDYFRQIKLDITSEIRLDVAKRTEEIFKKLITRAGEIKQIEIDPAYNMNVIDVNNDNIIRTLTAGQTLCLSLSYIAAVRAVTDTDYPMIIDSPLGRISGPERVELAKILPVYLEGIQMSFLVTDTEYSAPVEDSADGGKRFPSVKEVWDTVKRIWKRFNLKFDKSDPDNSDTTVEESK